MVLVVKKLPAKAGDDRDTGSIPGLGRSLGEGHEPTLVFLHGKSHGQRSLWATVHGVAKSWTSVSKQQNKIIMFLRICSENIRIQKGKGKVRKED